MVNVILVKKYIYMLSYKHDKYDILKLYNIIEIFVSLSEN